MGNYKYESYDYTKIGIGIAFTKYLNVSLSQDVSVFHNIAAEAELTAILSQQIAAEIDREILENLRLSFNNG